MRGSLLERRQEVLKLRGKGVSLAYIVKDLAEKYNVTPRAVYRDWQNRKTWLKSVLEVEDPETFFLELLGNHREIYRLTVIEYLKGDNSNARVGALRLLAQINRDFFEMVAFQDVVTRLNVLEEKVGEKAKERGF